MLRYAPENRSRPRALTGNWPIKNEKLTTRIKYKTWTNSQIKNQKMVMNSLNRPQTQHKNPKHMYLKF